MTSSQRRRAERVTCIEKTIAMPKVISTNVRDFDVPGVLIEVTAEDAKVMAITIELAISEADAMDANSDELIA